MPLLFLLKAHIGIRSVGWGCEKGRVRCGIILGEGKAQNTLNDVSACAQNTLSSPQCRRLSLTLRLVWEGDSELNPGRQTVASSLVSASCYQEALDKAASSPSLSFLYKVRIRIPTLRAAGRAT